MSDRFSLDEPDFDRYEPGLCACGCGRITPIASHSHKGKGWIKGQPCKYAKGCRGPKAIDESRYRRKQIGKRTIAIHRLRAERALGKPLPATAVVHHADGSKNHFAQLVICENQRYHWLLHIRMRVKAAGGNPNTDLVCRRCLKPKPFFDFHKTKGAPVRGHASMCKECSKAWRINHV